MDEFPQGREPHLVEFGELPELTRALRALGSARRTSGSVHTMFFLPLIEARRTAQTASTPRARLNAFDVAQLRAGLERCVDRIVSEWPDAREPARRAIRAQVLERVREYERALEHLRIRSDDLLAAEDTLRLAAWRAWTVQLQVVFQTADRTWLAIEAVVSTLTAKSRR